MLVYDVQVFLPLSVTILLVRQLEPYVGLFNWSFNRRSSSSVFQFHKVNKGASTHYDLVHMADDLCRFLLFLNNCMNFIIYMTGRQFRKGFFLIWYRVRQSLIRWLMCQSPQTDSTWHRHPPNKRRRNRHRRVVCDQKQACRLILAANQVGHGIYVHQHYVVHKPGCPLAVNRVSAASSVER